MRLQVAAAIAIVAASSAMAQEETPEYRAAVNFAAEVGSAAYIFGGCERYIPKAEADELVAEFTGANNPDKGEVSQMLATAWSQAYAEGRRDKTLATFTAQQCSNVWGESLEAVAKARLALPSQGK